MENVMAIMKGAAQGRTENQYLMGEKYFYGLGVETDVKVAGSWYKEAAKRGHAAAAYMYGYILLTGMAGTIDLKRGNGYMKKATRLSDKNAALFLARNYYYGYGLKKNDKRAYKLWKKGAKKGCAEAEYYLGLCYEKGIYVKPDVLKAKRHLLAAFENGFTVPTRDEGGGNALYFSRAV